MNSSDLLSEFQRRGQRQAVPCLYAGHVSLLLSAGGAINRARRSKLFIRGDADGSGSFSALVDGLFIFNFGFVPASTIPPCMKAVDADGDGTFTAIIDGIFCLNFGFVPGNLPPPAPFPSCGDDPSSPLSCDMPLSPPC